MEIVALATAALLFVVAFAERIAFAVMMYMLCAWTWRATAQPRAWLAREILVLHGRFKIVHEAILRWWAMRALRGQLARGATP